MDSDRGRSRRERTFVGSMCSVCEEPLEHILAGEKILQLSCGHVSHGACFYEFVNEFESHYCPTCNAPLGLDTSRGGNVIDIDQLSSIIRSPMSGNLPPASWDSQTVRPESRQSSVDRVGRQPVAYENSSMKSRDTRDAMAYENENVQAKAIKDGRDVMAYESSVKTRDTRGSKERESGRYTSSTRTSHTRNDSEATGITSTAGYSETIRSGLSRRNEHDMQQLNNGAMNSKVSSIKRPIPPPTVIVRSEYPTMNRSGQQQTLTCLVTVEVPNNKWTPDPEDLRMEPPTPQFHNNGSPPSPARSGPRLFPYEEPHILEDVTRNLQNRVENWHGLDFSRFGKLRLHGTIRVGKDKRAWQELECFLFAEMLICVKEKRNSPVAQQWDDQGMRKSAKCTLKGSILIKKHLNEVTQTSNDGAHILTLGLSVAELPSFHLQFDSLNQMKLWHQALLDLNAADRISLPTPEFERTSDIDEDDWQRSRGMRSASIHSSTYGGGRGSNPIDSASQPINLRLTPSLHVPIDVVVVIPVSSSMQGVKIGLVRDALKFMVSNLGDHDRMSLVSFGSAGGGVSLVGLATKSWNGWGDSLASIKPLGQKSHRADVLDGANVAMDLLMQRKRNNAIASILLISDASTSESESVDFVISRAEAAKVSIHTFGLGMTHKPDTMMELSTKTKASYTYVKDWMMLRECLAGCMGALQTISHQNVRLKLRLPVGTPAKFTKVSGALQITKRATGRDVEASLGDLRFGDRRDILVQLTIAPDNTSAESAPQDPWESIVSGLEALGGPLDSEDQRVVSVEEIPLFQADLTWGDILRDGTVTQLSRPSLLAITMLPASSISSKKSSWPASPPIPPHPAVVQRRMELLTSDMLTRALTLVSRGQNDRAQHLLNETRSILQGLGKGGLPPIPPPSHKSQLSNVSTPSGSAFPTSPISSSGNENRRTPSPPEPSAQGRSLRVRDSDGLRNPSGVDLTTVSALDAELEAALEWINHPAVFARDSRKAALQAIGVISSQRAYTLRTPIEELWATRLSGVNRLMNRSRQWREDGAREEDIIEES